jgi:cytoskeleton protein RodZ
MSDAIDKPEEDVANEDSGGPLAGERLAEARREQQIPIIEIAKELHLDEYKVRALESNDFEVIGAPVFAKGHLRKYAQLVQVDVAEVMADYYRLERSAAPPPVVGARLRQRDMVSITPWVAAIVVILVAAMTYWWFVARDDTSSASQPVIGAVTPLPQTVDDVEETLEPAATDVSQAMDEPVDEPQVLPEPEPEPQAEMTPPADDTETRMSITYLGDCWTEISDANGRRLFFDLGKAGRTVDLSGEAPFNVLFGNADNVTLVVNGEAFEIAAANRRGRTARLTIIGT